MADRTVVEVDHVWKKFRKGEIHDSLRDLIPAMGKRLIGRGTRSDQLSGKEFWALKDVCFSVKRGQSLGIIGPNGAGKSTMLKVLSRILKPNRGSYRVDGRVSALIEVGAGFHQDLTGRENIYLNGTILGMKRKEIRHKEGEIIEFAGVEEFIDTPVKRFSSGMKARLGFAVAAHMEPDVLLVDEVLSVGDARFRAKCIRHMEKLMRSNVTVVFISHLLDQVRALCSETVVLDQGQTVYHGETDGAIRKYLDLVSDPVEAPQHSDDPAEIRGIRLCDTSGQEVLAWQIDQPGIMRCELVIHEPVDDLVAILNLAALGGQHLGTSTTRRAQLDLPSKPGVYQLAYVLDPLPLNPGDYQMSMKLHTGSDWTVVWSQRQPRVFSIEGDDARGAGVRCLGQWEVKSAEAMVNHAG